MQNFLHTLHGGPKSAIVAYLGCAKGCTCLYMGFLLPRHLLPCAAGKNTHFLQHWHIDLVSAGPFRIQLT